MKLRNGNRKIPVQPDGAVMKRRVPRYGAIGAVAVVLAFGWAGEAVVANPAGAADIEEVPPASFRMSQRSDRNCTESCMADCRAARAECRESKADKETNNCPAQFQICVRRCVISCGPK
jgi:hypothetical protein